MPIMFLHLGGRVLKDDETLQSIGITNGGQLFYKDLGPQIAWKTVNTILYTSNYYVACVSSC